MKFFNATNQMKTIEGCFSVALLFRLYMVVPIFEPVNEIL